jgi:hypothetical protein
MIPIRKAKHPSDPDADARETFLIWPVAKICSP